MPLIRIAAVTLASLAALSWAVGAGAQQPDQPSRFTIENKPDDTLPTIRFKAALRLLAAVQTVYRICSECGGASDWKSYERRNGNTLNLASRQFANAGGLREEQKHEVDRYSEELRKQAYLLSSCPGLLAEVRDQKWDIYKAERFREDYELVKAR
ncbi:MAG: hypothetical protein LBG06_06650 [Deltaproteobacteria bacterium]|jgi:hypothetical protein|nr:hypothetical protein [Deltaproteobacteria bacterium]